MKLANYKFVNHSSDLIYSMGLLHKTLLIKYENSVSIIYIDFTIRKKTPIKSFMQYGKSFMQ